MSSSLSYLTHIERERVCVLVCVLVCVCVCVCVLCKKCSTLFVVQVTTVRSGQERAQWLVEFESVGGLVLGKEDKRSVLYLSLIHI